MAGSSASISHSESQSDNYIPEYSESPILQEIALHARAMSDYVYNWGMDRFNKNQGDIDSLMRDALSYASPQRIAVDMGMAEAGVQQAAERGRLSAIKDLESYGIDPSSGRYAALDQGNRVMSAAAAAGAGNQQRMADYAAGNAMRNQAIAAGQQNAQFGLGVGDSANKFLQTGMSLKYPPLGRQSTSVSDSESRSVQTDAPPAPKSPQDPKQQQDKGGGAGKEPGAGRQPAAAKPTKPPPKETQKPKKPGEEEGEEPKDELETGIGKEGDPITEPYYNPLGTETEDQPFQGAYDPSGTLTGIPPEMQYGGPYANMGIGPNGEVPAMGSEGPYSQVPAWPGDTPSRAQPDTTAGTEDPNNLAATNQPDRTSGTEDPNNISPTYQPDQTSGTEDPNNIAPPTGPMSEYDPYEGNITNALFTGDVDPVTGQPVNQTDEADTNTSDPAGSVYGLDPSGGGDWTLDVEQPTAADWGETTRSLGDSSDTQTGVYDSTYDTWTDADASNQAPSDVQFDDYTDTGGDFTDTGDTYTDPYADQTYDFGDDTSNFTDAGDYTDPGYQYDDSGDTGDTYDFGDDTSDFTDYDAYDDSGDDSYEDYADDYEDGDYEGGEEDSGDDYEDSDYEDSGDDYEDSGDEGYARGGQVRMRRGGMGPQRQPMPTGYQTMQRPARMTPPPQPPRPMRGAPMAQPGGPRPSPMPRGPMMPGNMISANGMPPPTQGGMPPQRMAQGGQAGRRAEPTRGGFVSRELSPSGGSKVDDVQARLNAGEFVIPKDVATWKGKEFFYKLISQARKLRSGEGNSPGNSPNRQNNSPRPQNNSPRPQTGYSRGMR